MLDSPHSSSTGIGHWKDRLEQCPECRRDLVQATACEALWGDRWLITLHCPNCGWGHEGIWPHAALRNFEEFLDQVEERLWTELMVAERARMTRDVEAFAGALASDAILPEDF